MRRKIWSARDIDRSTDGVGRADGIVAGGEGSELPASDVRLKEHISPIGRTSHDLPLYRFHYKGGSEEYSGVMAQDVLKVMPEAVSVGPDGFYRVNYRMLGIQMVRLDGGPAEMTSGGEGSGTEESDIRLKDRVERIGTVSIVIAD